MPEPKGPLQPNAAAKTFDRLAQRRMIVVSGKGGVGRTTMAAMIGLALAERGRRVLVATTGHDDRLAWMLGLPRLEPRPFHAGDRLSVQRLVPSVALREYGAMIVHSDRIAGAVFDNRIVRRLLGAIPGLDDFSVLGKAWHEAARGGTWDTVVFDGPATGHLVYTLGTPRAILSAVPPGPLTRESELMQATLTDPQQTEAVLVGLPEAWPLTELAELGDAVTSDLGMSIRTIIVNGVWPHVSDAATRTLEARERADDPNVAAYLRWLHRVAAGGHRHARAIDRFLAEGFARDAAREIICVPWRFGGIGNPTELQALRQEVEGTRAPARAVDQATG